MTIRNGEIVNLLLIEDNPDDIDLLQETLEQYKIIVQLHIVRDGKEALDFLRKEGIYAQAIRPDLILLDLNLPKMNGRQVLQAIKQDPAINYIPVVIMTTSQDEQDILRAYQLQASCYITKPVDLEQFGKVVRLIDQFWLTLVKLPPRGETL
ncbi:response regulator [Deltaproteobacteria bacterium TL4]